MRCCTTASAGGLVGLSDCLTGHAAGATLDARNEGRNKLSRTEVIKIVAATENVF